MERHKKHLVTGKNRIYNQQTFQITNTFLQLCRKAQCSTNLTFQEFLYFIGDRDLSYQSRTFKKYMYSKCGQFSGFLFNHSAQTV